MALSSAWSFRIPIHWQSAAALTDPPTSKVAFFLPQLPLSGRSVNPYSTHDVLFLKTCLRKAIIISHHTAGAGSGGQQGHVLTLHFPHSWAIFCQRWETQNARNPPSVFRLSNCCGSADPSLPSYISAAHLPMNTMPPADRRQIKGFVFGPPTTTPLCHAFVMLIARNAKNR